MPGNALVRMRGITKTFGTVHALRGVDLDVSAGSIHALLGENGAGKSTLMHILSGLVSQDAGTIAAGGPIGMVHQHFTIVPTMTVAENVWLGRRTFGYSSAEAADLVRRTAEKAGLSLDPQARASDLPVGLQQRLEILKALSRNVRILILDEPSGALAPSEVAALFEALRRLKADGLAIILITHKLREVMDIADRVTVLRRGAIVAENDANSFTREALARAMVGEGTAPAPAGAERHARASTILEVANLSVISGGRERVHDVTFEVRAHEIVGIAAVEGNGQRELLRAIAGLLRASGRITVGGDGRAGFIPEDRQQEGLILDFSLAENYALGEAQGFLMSRGYLESQAAVAVDEYGIRTAGANQPVRALSGGNQQKVVLSRVLGRRPAILVAENPTRGLDIRATTDVHDAIRRAASRDGTGVLFSSTDLDEVIELADRIGVMRNGRWTWARPEDHTRERLGALMLGITA